MFAHTIDDKSDSPFRFKLSLGGTEFASEDARYYTQQKKSIHRCYDRYGIVTDDHGSTCRR